MHGSLVFLGNTATFMNASYIKVLVSPTVLLKNIKLLCISVFLIVKLQYCKLYMRILSL